MGAYDDLMKALGDYEKSGGAERDRTAAERKRVEEQKRAQEEERQRQESEGKNATGARVRQGFQNMQEMRDAVRGGSAADTLDAPKKKKQNLPGGVRG